MLSKLIILILGIRHLVTEEFRFSDYEDDWHDAVLYSSDELTYHYYRADMNERFTNTYLLFKIRVDILNIENSNQMIAAKKMIKPEVLYNNHNWEWNTSYTNMHAFYLKSDYHAVPWYFAVVMLPKEVLQKLSIHID
eukprot:GHVL01035540.1.p1 GENE.GHVL01035540.1~~GHVL01035540.1.p1  ORF type:complete len:137 (-),score=19.86 GHVL01035540.1:230-640(-)